MKRIFLALALFAYIGSTSATSLVTTDNVCISICDDKGKGKNKKKKKECSKEASTSETKAGCSKSASSEKKACCAKKAEAAAPETK